MTVDPQFEAVLLARPFLDENTVVAGFGSSGIENVPEVDDELENLLPSDSGLLIVGPLLSWRIESQEFVEKLVERLGDRDLILVVDVNRFRSATSASPATVERHLARTERVVTDVAFARGTTLVRYTLGAHRSVDSAEAKALWTMGVGEELGRVSSGDRSLASDQGLNEKVQSLEQLLLDRDRHIARQADKILVAGRQASRASADITRQRERIHDLEVERATTGARLALANWKLASTAARKWSRIGTAIGRVRSNVLRIFVLPFEIVRITFSHSSLPPKPRPTRATSPSGQAGGTPQAMVATRQETTSSGTATEPNQEAPTAVGDMSSERYGHKLTPMIVTAPPAMSLAPPPVTTVKQLRVASILDEMSHQSFAPECNLTTFTPHNWLEVLERERPNLLLVESAWRGNSGSWEYKVGTYSYPESVGLPDLSAVVEWCRGQGIPTVFWNKEDPVHFEKFKEAAALFDVVFTTDANMAERYQELSGTIDRQVGVLPFAAQPLIHNPVGAMNGRDPRPVFAGAYYRNRHHSRRDQLDLLLDAATPFDLMIYDRMGGVVSDSFGFPERFQPYIAGRLPYDEMANAYRTHRLFLNVNSVSDSPTMFSRRVFELLASGTPVVSTSSIGVEQIFGGVVDIVETQQEASAAIARLIEDDDWWLDRSVRGIEAVFDGNTYADRLHTIARAAGLAVEPNRASISVVVSRDVDVTVGSIENLHGIAEVIRFDGAGATVTQNGKHVRAVNLEMPSSGSHAAAARAAARAASGEWLAFVDSPTDLRSLHSLQVATRIVPAEIFVPSRRWGSSHTFVPELVAGGPTLVARDFVERTSWSPWSSDATRAMGARIYSVPIVDA